MSDRDRYVIFEEFGQPVNGPRTFMTDDARRAAEEKIMDAFGLADDERELLGVLGERERPAREESERMRQGFLARLRKSIGRLERDILEQLR